MKIIMLGQMDNSDGSLEIANRVYSRGGISPCLNAHGGDTIPKIIEIRKLTDEEVRKLENEQIGSNV